MTENDQAVIPKSNVENMCHVEVNVEANVEVNVEANVSPRGSGLSPAIFVKILWARTGGKPFGKIIIWAGNSPSSVWI